MTRHRFPAILLLASAAVLLALTPVSAQQYRADGPKTKSYIEYLASDALQGRQTLTPGFQKAADWVAARFKEWGLRPCGDEGTSYFQKVPITRTGAQNLGVPSLSLDGRSYYFDDNDFTPNGLSTAKTTVKAEVVFVGYGISLPAKGLDEYAGQNVQGKVVLALKGSPEDFAQPRGFFTEGAAKYPPAIGLTPAEVTDAAKIKTAYEKGAAAVLLYNPDPDASFGGLVFMGMPGGRPETPALDVKRDFLVFDVTERVFRGVIKRPPQESSREYAQKLNALRWDIRTKKVRSKATGVMAVLKGYDVVYKFGKEGVNVIGKIEGADPELKTQYIVLGGHLDHLGTRGTVVYNGADDDASGVAVVMEAARVLATGGFKPKRTIVFAAWCGEEMGLLGSNYFGSKPPAGITMDRVVANFNCDMVGLGDAIGAPGALNFPDIWEKVISRGQDPDVIAAVKPSTGGPGGSDHSTFITKGIISMALMTSGGVGHPDYHDSGDRAAKIDPEILRKTAQFVVQGTMNLADESAVNLLVPDRLYLYNSLMLRIPIINTRLAGSAWKNSDYPDKGTLLAKMSAREIQRAAQVQAMAMAAARAANTPMMMMSPPSPPAQTAAPVWKDLSQGVRTSVFAGDAKLMEIAANSVGFGRVDFTGDDGVWVVNGRLTEAGKSAIKTIEASALVVHLVSPGDDLLADVLAAAEKPLVISGTYNLSPAAKDVVVAKKAVVSVDLDSTDVDGSLEKADNAKKLVGGASNLVAFVVSADNLNELGFKRAFYFGLIKRGWTADEIAAFTGGSLQPLANLGIPAMYR